MAKDERQISIVVTDTDTLSMFIRRNAIGYFIKFFKNEKIRIIVPQVVVDELEESKKYEMLGTQIRQMERNKQISIEDIALTSDAYLSYVQYKEDMGMGKGEAAALSIAIHNYKGQAVLASNNLRDVKTVAEKNNLKIYTTATIIRECVESDIFTLERANVIWEKMIEDGERLPDTTFDEYIEKYSKGERL